MKPNGAFLVKNVFCFKCCIHKNVDHNTYSANAIKSWKGFSTYSCVILLYTMVKLSSL